MRLMPLCAWLLALRGTPGDFGEVNLLDYNGSGPCDVTLTPGEPCERGEDDVRCPYLFNVPPLTIHLPKQLRELERIVEELQALKDNVDELRRMCADCTVRQTGRECDAVNEGMSRKEDGSNWLNADSLNDFSLEDGTKGVRSGNRSEGCRERDAGKRISEEKDRGGAERPSNTGVTNEDRRGEGKQVAVSGTRAEEVDRWTTSAGGSGKSVDLVIGVDEKNREGKRDGRKNDMSGKENSRGDVLGDGEEGVTGEHGKAEDREPRVGQERTEEIEIKTQNKENSSSYVINMSDFHGEHTNKRQRQHMEERKKEMEKGIKAERGNEKLIQAEGREKASERGELDENKETGLEIKTGAETLVQGAQTDGDGGLAPSKDTAETNAASKGQTPSTSGGGPRQESADWDTAPSYGSSHRSPAVSSSTPPFPGGNKGLTTSADGLQTQTFMTEPGFGAPDRPAVNARPAPGRQGFAAAGSTSATPVDDVDEVMRPTVATTAPPDETKATFPGASDHHQSPTRKMRTGMKPLPEKNSRINNVRVNNSRKPDQGPFTGKKTQHDQKQKPPFHKPVTKPRHEDPRLFRGLKPNQRTGRLPADLNLKNNQTQKGVRGNTTGQTRPNIQNPKSASRPFLPVQRPTSRQRNQSVHVSNPDKHPPTKQKPKSTQIPNISQNQKISNAEKKRLYLLKMERTLRKPASEEKPKLNQKPELTQSLRDVHGRSTPQPFHRPDAELLGHADGNPLAGTKDLAPGQKVTPTPIPITIPNRSQKPDSNPDVNSELGMMPNQDNQELETKPRSESNVMPKVQQTPTQTPQPPRLSSKLESDSEANPRAESSNAPLPKQRSHTRPVDMPGATSAERSKAPMPLKPISKTETDSDSLQMTRATLGPAQISQTNTPPPPAEPLSGVNIHPGETGVSSIQVMTKTLSSPEDGVDPHLNTLPEDLAVSPLSRIMSDLRPQTSAPVPAIQATAIPNGMTQEDKQIQASKPDRRPRPEALPTDQETRGPEHAATVIPPIQSHLTDLLPESVETSRADQNPDPELKTADGSESETSLKPDGGSTQQPESENTHTHRLPPKPVQTPLTGMMENPVDSEAGSEPVLLDPNLVSRKKFPQINPEPVPAPKNGLTQRDSDLTADPEAEHNPEPYKTPVRGFKTPLPDPTPRPALEPVPDRAETPSPPPGHRSPSTPTAQPGQTSAQGSTPSLPLKSGSKPEPELDPSQMATASSDPMRDLQMNLPPSPGPVKLRNDVGNSPEDTQVSTIKTMTLDPRPSSGQDGQTVPHLHTLPGDFTTNPNSRITSPQNSQTTAAPPSVRMTGSPNGTIPRILSSAPPSDSPAQPKRVSHVDSKLHHSALETTRSQSHRSNKEMDAAPSSPSPGLGATGPAKSGAEPRAPGVPADSARELRVKINQVAAFFNDSRSAGGRHPERPEDKQSGGRINSKLLTRIPSKVTMVMRDCSDHLLRGQTRSGVYVVTPDLRGKSFPVFCDMELLGGGWTLLQRRQDGSVSFNRTWDQYRSGFGELAGGEFWLGNNRIHLLTRERDMRLRVELEDFEGEKGFAEYSQFRVASERLRYTLTVGGYSGNAGNALRFSKTYDHNHRAFTTPDRDHDRYPSGNCGAYYSSGWWFDACMAANLNGRYYTGRYKGVRDGIYWGTWHNISSEYYPTNDRQSFRSVRMMIRPKEFVSRATQP